MVSPIGPSPDRVVLKIVAAAGGDQSADRPDMPQSLTTASTSALSERQPFHNPFPQTGGLGGLIYAGPDGQLWYLPIGLEGQVLTVVSVEISPGVFGLVPRWQTP